MRENGGIIDVASECGIVRLGEASRDLQGKYLSPTLTTEQLDVGCSKSLSQQSNLRLSKCQVTTLDRRIWSPVRSKRLWSLSLVSKHTNEYPSRPFVPGFTIADLNKASQGIDWQHFGIDSIVQMWSILRMPNWETRISIVMVKKCSRTLISKMRVTRRISRDIFNTTAKSVPSVFLNIGEEEKYFSKDEKWEVIVPFRY